MANIDVVIKIDEEEYKNIKAYTSFMPWAEYLIKNGKPLPKGHGRLIDAENVIPLALKKKTLVLKDTDLIAISSREFVIDYLFKDIKDYINNMPTIIEADKENG